MRTVIGIGLIVLGAILAAYGNLPIALLGAAFFMGGLFSPFVGKQKEVQ